MGLVAILGILETAGSKSLAFGGHRRYHKGVKCVEIILIDDSFEKGDHCRAPRLHLHYIWPRSQPPELSPGKLLIKACPGPPIGPGLEAR
jgi:hypothetical protein